MFQTNKYLDSLLEKKQRTNSSISVHKFHLAHLYQSLFSLLKHFSKNGNQKEALHQMPMLTIAYEQILQT